MTPDERIQKIAADLLVVQQSLNAIEARIEELEVVEYRRAGELDDLTRGLVELRDDVYRGGFR